MEDSKQQARCARGAATREIQTCTLAPRNSVAGRGHTGNGHRRCGVPLWGAACRPLPLLHLLRAAATPSLVSLVVVCRVGAAKKTEIFRVRGLQWLSTGRHSSTVLSPRYRFDLASILFIYPGRHRKRVAHSSGGRSARETTRLFPERHPRHPHTCRRTVGHHSDSTRSHADTRTLATKLLLLTVCANDDPL